MTEINVSTIVNKITFKVDQSSYQRAIKMVRRVGAEWSKVQSKMNSAMVTGRTISGGGRGGSGGRGGGRGGSGGRGGGRGGSGGRGGGRGGSGGRGGGLVGPMPSRDMLIARREAIRNQRNESNRSARAQETISAGNIRRTSMFGGAGNAAMGQQVASLNAQLKSGAISLQVYRQSIAALERDFKRASAGGRDFLGTLREVRSAFIALTAANLAFTGGAAVMRTGQMFEGINAAMSMTSDSTSETASKIQFIRDEAYRLGLDLKTAAQGFVQMSVAGKEVMNGGQMQELFTGFSEYATALGVDQFRYEKGILAIGQMLNKQQIMA